MKAIQLGLLCTALYSGLAYSHPCPPTSDRRPGCDTHIFGTGGDLKKPLPKEDGQLCSKFETLLVQDLSYIAGLDEKEKYSQAAESYFHYLEQHAGFDQIGSFDPYRCGENIVNGAWVILYPIEEGIPALEITLFYNQDILRKGYVPLSLLEAYATAGHSTKEEADITKKLVQIVPIRCKPAPEPKVPTIDLR
ncbi:hypothetical protein HYX12_04410 [Candidatus Woesearchaeota archaeon]|nr:hypothetical protein [Candidatus Woesearchaeota archaeon]